MVVLSSPKNFRSPVTESSRLGYAVPFSARVVAVADALVQELDGESVFLNVRSGQYFGLDKVGTDMWKALVSADSVQGAYEMLQQEYDVEAERLQHDLNDIVQKLVDHGLIETCT